MMSTTLKARAPRWLLALSMATIAAAVAAQEPTNTPLTSLQQARGRVLQLEAENEQLRRALLTLQVQIEQARAAREAPARESAWQALEQDLGCALDRQTLTCKTRPAGAPSSR